MRSSAIQSKPASNALGFPGSSFRCFALVAIVLTVPPAVAPGQPPGTLPPQQSVQRSAASNRGGVRPDAFFFLDETGTPVMMPGMSWEELERLMNIQEGTQSALESFVFESLRIKGTANGTRGELDVHIELTVEPSSSGRLAIPLQMANFNLLSVRQVTGVDRHWVTVGGEGQGYVLWVDVSEQSRVEVDLSFAVRVQRSPTSSIAFELPDVSSTIRLRADRPELRADIRGRGDEVVQSNSDEGGSEFLVESSGGRFELLWSPVDPGGEDAPLLEVDSEVNVRWDDPQDQPQAEVQLRVRERRSQLSEFEVQLPPGSILLDSAQVDATDSEAVAKVEISQPISGPNGNRITVLVPDESRLKSIDVLLNLQLENTGATESSPMLISVPEVVGAIEHKGTLVVETSNDYRLRWKSQRWVEATFTDESVEGSSRRSYEFRIERGSVGLPVWLAAQRRQLRLTMDSEITFRDETASLSLEIRPNRQAIDGRITFDPAGWTVRSISNLETGELIDSFEAGSRLELTLNSRGEEPASVQIFAEEDIDPNRETIELTLPQVVEREQNVLVQSSTLTLRRSGRDVFVVDLAASTRIDRLGEEPLPQSGDPAVSRFRVLPSDSPAKLVGTMVRQSQRLTIDGDGRLQLDGQELLTTLDWQLTSQFDLEGELVVRIDRPITEADEESAINGIDSPNVTAGAAGDASAGVTAEGQQTVMPTRLSGISVTNLANAFDVTVDDFPAELRPLGGDLYRVVSDRLGAQPVVVRWQLRQAANADRPGDELIQVPMPRPVRNDLVVEGGMPINLVGNSRMELIVDDASRSTKLMLDTLPTEPLRVRLHSRSTAASDLAISKAVLRTAVGEESRHEQLVAVVRGSDLFRLRLPDGARNTVVKARVDDQQAEVVIRDGDILVSLPTDDAEHRVDVRVWLSMPLSESLQAIAPALRLPTAVDRIYWQLTVPRDVHVVWASPSAAQAMYWRFDRWSWRREPIETDDSLVLWAGGQQASLWPSGNQYLYFAANVPAFRVRVASKALIWGLVGTVVLLTAVLLTYLPRLRHPLFAFTVLFALAGLLVYSPDAAVIAAQLAAVASLLVIVMLAIRSLLSPDVPSPALSTPNSTIRPEPKTGAALAKTSQAGGSQVSGSRSASDSRRSSVSETQALPGPAPSEVAS